MADTATEEKTEPAQAAAGGTRPPQVETPQRAADEQATRPEAGSERGPAAEAEAAHAATEEGPGEAARESHDRDSPARPIDFLGGLELEAAAELGRARLSINDVLKLRPGSVVQLEKMLGDPVELMVKDRLIARGEVVVVDDRFGLRITEVLSRESE